MRSIWMDRRDLIAFGVAAICSVGSASAAVARSADDEGGEGGDAGDWGDDDGGDWDDDAGDDEGGEWGNESGWDDDSSFDSGSEYGDRGPSIGPGLGTVEQIAVGKNESEPADPMRYSDEDYYGSVAGENGDFLSSAIDAISGALDSVISEMGGAVGQAIDAIESLASDLFVCVDLPTEPVSPGLCVTGAGNVYSTQGGGVSLAPGHPTFGIAPGGADGFLSGPSAGGIGLTGWGIGVTTGSDWAVLFGDPGLSYSEGTFRGNVVQEAGDFARSAANGVRETMQSWTSEAYDRLFDAGSHRLP